MPTTFGPAYFLTQRRKDILNYLLANKVGTFKQIRRDLFPGLSQSVASRHLSKLWHENLLIKSFARIDGKHIQISSLGPEAIGILSDLHENKFDRLELSSGKIKHDLFLNDLRHKLTQYGDIARYYTENELTCFPECREDPRFYRLRHLRPDAVVSVKVANGECLVPLEFELSRKTMNRYRDKLEVYYEEEKIPQILYIAATPGIEKTVSSIEKEIMRGNEPKFFFSQIQKVLEAGDKMTFTNVNGHYCMIKKVHSLPTEPATN